MSELKRPERYVHFESIKPKLKEITEFYTRKVTDYQYRLKQLNEYADALENEISVLKEKPIKVPQYLADWFENQLKINESKKFDGNDVFRIIQDVIKVSNDEITWEDYGITDEIVKFAEDNEELFLNLIVNCSLGYGYTVEKEKLYVLKHIDMSKFSEDSSLYLSRSIKAEVFGKYGHMRVADGVDVSEIEQCHFTQSEIGKLNVGSYEQIEVKP